MSDMVERVAIALCDKALWDGAWLQANETERNEQRYRARAAIEAMREPTEAMVHADTVKEWPSDACAAWKAMIDEALK